MHPHVRTLHPTPAANPEQASRPELHALADRNILAALRAHASWQAQHELVDADGLLLLAGQTSFPGAFKNCAARLDPTLSANEVIDRAQAFFGARGRGYTLFSLGQGDADLESAARARGFQLRLDMPSMLLTQAMPMPPLPPDIRLEAIHDTAQLADLTEVCARAYQALGLDPAETHAYFSQPQALLDPTLLHCVAYRGSQALACALALPSEQAYGIYWVATVPEAQRSGLASACTAQLSHQALARGARLVTLQASPFGAPVYQRLGYATYSRFKLWRAPEAT